MVRKNNKKQVVSQEYCIKKSNELSMAKLNQGLSLNQMQLLAYAIYSTQQDGKTEFHKADFEKRFGISRYLTEDACADSNQISALRFSTSDLEKKQFRFTPIFSDLFYLDGKFTVEWNVKFIPHILELKEKYVLTDLTITSNFKSAFSWTLYEYLKAHYGYWHKPISKEALMRLFGVEDRKTYVQSTAQFKRGVLDVAVAELNEYTEFDVWYQEEKKGRSIVGFDLQWSSGEKVPSATKKQIQELKTITDAISDDMFKYINLNNPNRRNQAIDLVRKTETMRIHTKEPICITKTRAEKLIQDANEAMLFLEKLYEADQNNEEERDTSFYYNWLREENV